jgi:hypothetical protein
MTEAVITTATTNGKPLVKCVAVVMSAIKSTGATNIAATITTPYTTSFWTTREAIRSTSLSFNCWPTAMLYHPAGGQANGLLPRYLRA